MSQENKPIGRILLEQKAITQEQLDESLADRTSGGRLASRLAESGSVSEVDALKALSEQHGIPGIDLSQLCLRLEDLDVLPREIAEKHLILPVLMRDDRLFVAMGNPRETKVLDELEFVTGKKVYPYVALETSLKRVIVSAYQRKARGEAYYVGPHCPTEVLERLGIGADGIRRAGQGYSLSLPLASMAPQAAASSHPPASEQPPESEIPSPPSIPTNARAVVVDDALARSASEDVHEADFGDLSRELSVVTDMPTSGAPGEVAPGTKTVLVVDDEADIRKMVTRLLQTRGLRVIEADRGLLALRLVKEHHPDLIVLDAMLPEVHGFDIARRIKNSERYKATPIVMMSAVYRGWRFAEDLKQSCGVEHYIEKPFRIDDLLRAVDACLAGTSQEPLERNDSAEAEAALNEGVAAYKAGHLEEAVGHLKRGVAIDPLAYRLHFHLGLLYGKQGHVYEAISELETAMELNSRHFAAAKNLAILYQKAGFRNKASETWERALRLAPDEETRKGIREHLLNLL